jgi:hypothetical protein
MDGWARLFTPFRAEFYGLLFALYILHWAELKYSIQKSSVTLYCDNKRALKNASSLHPLSVKIVTQKDYDIILEIHYVRELFVSTIKTKWIKSHYRGGKSTSKAFYQHRSI